MEKEPYSIAIGFSSSFVIFLCKIWMQLFTNLYLHLLQCDFADSLKRLIFPPLALERLCDLPLLIECGKIGMCQCWLHLKRLYTSVSPLGTPAALEKPRCEHLSPGSADCPPLEVSVRPRSANQPTCQQKAGTQARPADPSSEPSFVKTKWLYSESH